MQTPATIPYQRPAFIYGEILSRSNFASTSAQQKRPGIGTYLSQGAATGGVTLFLILAIYILLRSTDGYISHIAVVVLPFFLPFTLVLGLLQGFVIWGSSRLAHRVLGWLPRVAIGVLVMATVVTLWILLYTGARITEPEELIAYLPYIAVYLLMGMIFGLFTGSRLQPWRSLVRGMEPTAAGSRLLAGFTGLLLRLAIVFFLMESFLLLIYALQEPFQRDSVFTLLAFVHFSGSLAIVSLRLKFWWLLTLALLVNVPAILIVREFPTEFMHCVSVGYFAAWALFLLTRWRPTYSALAYLKDEFRYYLID